MGINIFFNEIEKELTKTLRDIFNSINEQTGLKKSKIKWDIYFYPLKIKEEIHNKYMQTPFNGNRSYRALTHTKHKKTFIFLNEGENIHSLSWVIAHELTHINILQNNYLNSICKNNYFKTLNERSMSNGDYEKNLKNDDFHDSLLEEQIANSIATGLIGKNYGREWWRNQLLEIDSFKNKKV